MIDVVALEKKIEKEVIEEKDLTGKKIEIEKEIENGIIFTTSIFFANFVN